MARDQRSVAAQGVAGLSELRSEGSRKSHVPAPMGPGADWASVEGRIDDEKSEKTARNGEVETRMLEGLTSAWMHSLSCSHVILSMSESARLGNTAASFLVRDAASRLLRLVEIQSSSVMSMASRTSAPSRVSWPKKDTMCAGDEGYWERYDNTRASASRTFLALVELGALIAYLGGIEGNVLHVLALRERTGVSGGVIMGIVGCSRSCGKDGVAR